MKNKLCPLQSTSGGEYEPALIEHGYRWDFLVRLGNTFVARSNFQNITVRADLRGRVHGANGRTIVETDDGQLFIVADASTAFASFANSKSKA